MKIKIELIPKKSWGNNLAKKLKGKRWDMLRKEVYGSLNRHCFYCGDYHPEPRGLAAHEVWEFDRNTQFQILVDIVPVCSDCHNLIHFGRTQTLGEPYISLAIEKYNKVNDHEIPFEIHKTDSYIEFLENNKITWKLDLSYLNDKGIVYDAKEFE